MYTCVQEWWYASARWLSRRQTCDATLRMFYVSIWGGVGGVNNLLLSLMMHRNVLAVHYLNKNPGLNSVLLALARFRMYAETSYTPVSQVFPNALWEWKKNADRTSYPKKYTWNLTTKNLIINTRLGSQRQNTASTNTKQPSLILTGVSQWIWSFFHINMNMLKQKTPKKNRENKMKPTNPNAHTYVNGTDVKTHGYAVTHNSFLQ